MTGFRIIVCGSRNWSNETLLRRSLDLTVAKVRYIWLARLEEPPPVTIVHGDCPPKRNLATREVEAGADYFANCWARDCGLMVERHPADWNKYGNAAGPIRNTEMAAKGANLCVAFWDGESRGTGHMIATATKAGIPVNIVPDVFSQALTELLQPLT